MTSEIEKKWLRVRRAASADSDLQAFADDLRSKHRAELVRLAEEGEAPIRAISGGLRERLSAEKLAMHSTRLFVGLAVGAVMAEEGFEPAGMARLRDDPVFRSATRFRRVREAGNRAEFEWLKRFARMLTDAETKYLSEILTTDFGQSDD